MGELRGIMNETIKTKVEQEHWSKEVLILIYNRGDKSDFSLQANIHEKRKTGIIDNRDFSDEFCCPHI